MIWVAGVKPALDALQVGFYRKEISWVLDADIQKFFDEVDHWVNKWRNSQAQGDMIIIRYADDSIIGFQRGSDARLFVEQFSERMHKFGLTLHPDKTRLIRFGRYVAKERRARGERKPEEFDFLGFTHYFV